MLYFYILKYVCVNNYSNHLNLLGRFLQCGFGSVRFRFLVFAIGPVRFMFGFGSCGSWSISVRFGSVFGTFCIDICFFSGVGKANTDCFPQEVYCFPQEVSWAAAFKERRELNSENQSFLKLPVHAIYYEEIYICFFHWIQKAITTFTIFPISLWGRARRFRFLRFGFAHGSSGSRFLRFIGYLIFYGSVPRFRFGSWTLLLAIWWADKGCPGLNGQQSYSTRTLVSPAPTHL